MHEDQVLLYTIAGVLLIAGTLFPAYIVRDAIENFEKESSFTLKSMMLLYVLWTLAYFAGGFSLVEAITFKPPPPNNLIILDIDGVLNHNKAPQRLNVSHLYDPECVDRMNSLIEETNSKLVICSAWRIGQSIDSMTKILDSIGLKGEVIGLTMWESRCETRDDEITAWLAGYDIKKHQIHGIVVIDDDGSERFSSITVQPSWDNLGFQSVHKDQAYSILSEGLPKDFDIGTVTPCESTVEEEMNFGGHKIQEIPSSTLKEN